MSLYKVYLNFKALYIKYKTKINFFLNNLDIKL